MHRSSRRDFNKEWIWTENLFRDRSKSGPIIESGRTEQNKNESRVKRKQHYTVVEIETETKEGMNEAIIRTKERAKSGTKRDPPYYSTSMHAPETRRQRVILTLYIFCSVFYAHFFFFYIYSFSLFFLNLVSCIYC